ncbi:hypothetical protein BX070DRAFT_224573 [Coemansia spiralis]|nr:hypothetical protein BX070DRAFT_224573 [Coemansia spiralis]
MDSSAPSTSKLATKIKRLFKSSKLLASSDKVSVQKTDTPRSSFTLDQAAEPKKTKAVDHKPNYEARVASALAK